MSKELAEMWVAVLKLLLGAGRKFIVVTCHEMDGFRPKIEREVELGEAGVHTCEHADGTYSLQMSTRGGFAGVFFLGDLTIDADRKVIYSHSIAAVGLRCWTSFSTPEHRSLSEEMHRLWYRASRLVDHGLAGDFFRIPEPGWLPDISHIRRIERQAARGISEN